MKPDEILIIGLGLIGGSLGLALQGSALVKRISGYDVQQEAVARAISMGAIDESPALSSAVYRADIIFLCTSLAAYPEIIDGIRPYIKAGTIITDVGSTKKKVMALFAELPEDIYGIGGHPMAGAEIAGIKGADRYLFENAVYVLTSFAHTPPAQVDKLSRLVAETGAKVQIMDADLHDKVVAQVSHLPHLAAVALLNITGADRQAMMMAAGGFRDTTRVASGNSALWQDIILSNQKYIVAELDCFIAELEKIKTALEEGKRGLLGTKLEEARSIRERIPHLQRTYVGGCADIICMVPDQPGIIGYLGNILGSEQVNVVDLEILRVREGDGGTIRISVPDYEAARRAVTALQKEQIKAWIK